MQAGQRARKYRLSGLLGTLTRKAAHRSPEPHLRRHLPHLLVGSRRPDAHLAGEVVEI